MSVAAHCRGGGNLSVRESDMAKATRDDVMEKPESAARKEAAPKPEKRKDAAEESRVAENLRLWTALKRTDPRATKPFTRSGGFRGTQIDPAWRLQAMTEAFGPVGQGWGYEQTEWTIVEGMVFTCVRVWYRDPKTGEKCFTGPQWGGTELMRRRRDGSEEPNDEAFKMSVTDALGKCLLQLGLAADVYLGLFDDSKYREESEAYFVARSNPELQPEAIDGFERQVRERLTQVSELDQLDEVWKSGVGAKLREIGLVDKAAQQRITAYFSQKKADILRQEEEEPRVA